MPIFSLNEIDFFNNNNGYLAGTTNQLFLNYPKAKADFIINIDKSQIIPTLLDKNDKTLKYKLAKNHTNYEKLLISKVISKVSFLEDSQNLDHWDQTDFIRTQMRSYLNNLITILASLRKKLEIFEKQYSPENIQLNFEMESKDDY